MIIPSPSEASRRFDIQIFHPSLRLVQHMGTRFRLLITYLCTLVALDCPALVLFCSRDREIPPNQSKQAPRLRAPPIGAMGGRQEARDGETEIGKGGARAVGKCGNEAAAGSQRQKDAVPCHWEEGGLHTMYVCTGSTRGPLRGWVGCFGFVRNGRWEGAWFFFFPFLSLSQK